MGVEPSRDSSGNSRKGQEGGAESGALGAWEARMDAELAELVDAWSSLPAAIKAGILAMIVSAR